VTLGSDAANLLFYRLSLDATKGQMLLQAMTFASNSLVVETMSLASLGLVYD
jgi:hypothetical protein